MARRAVAFDIAEASWVGNRVFMHYSKTDDPNKPRTPGTFYGSAGVGTVALRLYLQTGEDSLLRFAEQCCQTVASRYTNKIWQDWGLAGCGELLIDAAQFLHDDRFLAAAYYLAEGIMPHRILGPDGVVFPGSELLRVSCDFGVGSAGIGVFLHRLLNPRASRFLMMDDVLVPNRPVACQSRIS
jgi:hypothetical protein